MGLEADLVPGRFPDGGGETGKLRRYVSWKTLKGIGRVPVGYSTSGWDCTKFHPHVAFTSGGYVAVPAGLAARLNSVPLLMHQQDVPPNLSRTIIAPLATYISVAFADLVRFFPCHARHFIWAILYAKRFWDVCQITPQQARHELGFAPDISVSSCDGGSQGARHL